MEEIPIYTGKLKNILIISGGGMKGFCALGAVTKLKELHIENKLNPAFIKELLAAIEFTYKKFKEDQNLKPENFYQVCLSYIDSRRPSVSDYRAHVDF
jgi:hypothetical protein